MSHTVTPSKRQAKPRWKRRKDARPGEIVAAALDVFGERGFAATKLADVARRAGVTKGTVYLYFDTKEALVSGLQARYMDTLTGSAGMLLQGDGNPLERLDRFLVSTVEFHLTHRQLHDVLFHETGMRDDETLRQLANTLAAFIADGTKARVFHADDPAFSAQFILHGLHGVLVSFLHRRTANRAEFIASCQATVHQLLGVSTTSKRRRR